MKHLDEGTIHAWIDGALDTAHSREVEAHVAECAACGAAVAEARGFVAGASRILLALDDVPAGVTPKRAPTLRRQWRAAPWVTGIAAALVLAIGISTWNRGVRTSERGTVATPERAVVTDSATSTPTVAQTPQILQTSPPPAIPSRAEPVRSTARQDRSTRAAANAPSRRETDDAQASRRLAKSNVEGEATAGAETRIAVSRAAEAPVAALSAPAAPSMTDLARDARTAESDTARLRRTRSAQRLEQVVVTTSTSGGDQRGALVGCYRVVPEWQPREMAGREAAAPRVATGAGSSRVQARTSAPAAASADFMAASAPQLLRLDTTQTPTGLAVRAARSDSSIGSWRRTSGDTARVELLSGASFVVSRKDRVQCP